MPGDQVTGTLGIRKGQTMKAVAYKLIAVYDCEECHGQGHFYDPHCSYCDDENWWMSSDVTMPCGYTVKEHLIESYDCVECAGKGMIRKEVDLLDALRDLGVPYGVEVL